MTNISNLEFELSFIKNNDIRRLTEDILKYKVPDYIETYPSSSSSRYHPVDENGNVVTILHHTKAVVRVLITIINHPMVSGQLSDFEKDICIAAAILHDSVKYGIPDNVKETTVHEHPILVSLLYPYNDTNSEYYLIFGKIVEIISSHHGPWQTSSHSQVVLPPIETTAQWYVHLADFLASRRFIHVDTTDSDDIKRSLT